MSGPAVIAHLTPHLGGGVGRVLLNYLAAAENRGRQRLLCLDYANDQARRRAAELGLALKDRLGGDQVNLRAELAGADLVVLHWWNHPQLYQWLVNGDWPPARLLIWSHVSGGFAPQVITPELAAFPDLLACASPVSLKLPALAGAETRLLFSSAGVAEFLNVEPQPHQGFRIGYLGTVDYAKMHPDFLGLCLAAELPPEARFVVAGGPDHERLRLEADALGAGGRFDILGPIRDVSGFLAGIDVFAYPLNPEHYGTGEQALIEALAAGVPAAVLGGGAEAFVVEDGLSGLVAADEAAFGPALRRLYEDAPLRRRLSAGARERAALRFGLEKTVQSFEKLYGELMSRPKRTRAWPDGGQATPWQLFLTSQGAWGPWYEKLLAEGPEAVTGLVWPGASLSATRGSVFHYRDFFPDDPSLGRCAELMKAVCAASGPGDLRYPRSFHE